MFFIDDAFAGQTPRRRIEVQAPAKVNLLLAVHPASDAPGDSRHLVDTVMHTIGLADTLVLRAYACEPEHAGELTLTCHPDVGVAPQDNLAYRAVVVLAQKLGRDSLADVPDECLHLTITKQVPAQAGLGGGSSDAAAALLAAATLWGVDPASPQVTEAARELGSDIAFFLAGAAALMDGYGDNLVRTLEPLHGHLCVVKPDLGVSTGAAYQAFDNDPPHLPDPVPLLAAFDMREHPSTSASRTSHAALAMGNNLAPAAESILPELAHIRTWLEEQPRVLAAQLSGSGSATFAICGTQESAFEVAREAQAQGWYAMPSWFADKGVHVVEDRWQQR